MDKHRDIKVDINIEGDVSSSTITGVTINYQQNNRASAFGNLLTQIFVDFLHLPSFQELDAGFSVWNARRNDRFLEFGRVRDLWDHATQGTGPYRSEPLPSVEASLSSTAPDRGIAVKINHIQLTPFASRRWGHPYLHSHSWDMQEYPWGMDELPGETLITPSYTWMDVVGARDDSVTRLGLGDVRLKPSNDGLHLLNVVSAGSSRLAADLDLRHEPGEYHGMHPWDRSSYGLGKRLYEFTQSILIDPDSVDQLTVGGFPVVMTSECYSEIIDAVQTYGAAALDSLTGTIIRVPDVFPTDFENRTPRWCVYVGIRAHLENVKKPEPLVCSAWTAIAGHLPVERYRGGSFGGSNVSYGQWMFRVGTPAWNQELENAVEVIETVREKVGAVALFEFDEEKNWYGPNTPFTPATMREMYVQFQQNRLRDLTITKRIEESAHSQEENDDA